jgi:hypothetical protein
MRTGARALGFMTLLVLAVPGTAQAYVGPGLGVGAIAAFLGAVLAVVLAIVGVVWYPLKRFLNRNKPKEPGAGDPQG